MHSPLYLPRLPLLIILTIFFALACKDRKQPESVQPPTEKVVLPATVMNDSIWKADSIKLIELWGQYWQADQYFPDTAIAICKEMIRIGSRAMDFKFDSVLYEKYAKAHGGIGFNLNVKGELNESLEATLHSYELISDKFGENHIRNTELCVGRRRDSRQPI